MSRTRSISAQHFSIFDYILLVLLASLGLVFIRLTFIYASATAVCAEQVLAFGYVEDGIFANLTVWHLFYYCSLLSAIFYALVQITERPVDRSMVVVVFRSLILIAFLGLAQMNRIMLWDDSRPPPTLLVLSADDYQALEAGKGFDRRSIRAMNAFNRHEFNHQTICFLPEKNELVLPNNSFHHNLRSYLFGKRGGLAKAFRQSQIYIRLDEEESLHIEKAIAK